MKHKPVLLDSSVLWALTTMYALYCVWGVLAFFNGIATITNTGGVNFGSLWALVVCTVSAILAPMATIGWERAEKWLTVAWIGVVSIYPFSLIYQNIFDPSQNRVPVTALAFAYLVIPLWRALFLFRKGKS